MTSFAPGDRVRWAEHVGFDRSRVFIVTQATETATDVLVEAKGPKRGQSIRSTWPTWAAARIERIDDQPVTRTQMELL